MDKVVQADDRIAIVSHAHPSISKGGAEIAAYTLFTGLQRLGHQVCFIAAVPYVEKGRLHLGGPHERAVFYETHRYDHFNQLGTPRVAAELIATLRAERSTLVNFHHYLNFGIGSIRAVRQALNLPCFVTLHEFLAMCAHNGQMVTRPARLLCESSTPLRCSKCFPERLINEMSTRSDVMREVLAAADGLISPSRFLAERHIAWGLDRERFNIVENGLPRFSTQGPAASRPAGAPFVFSYFGQINPFKGADLLLHVAEMIALEPKLAERVELRLNGNLVGQDDAFMARLSHAETLPFFRFLGPYDNDNVGWLMGEADYVVVPSIWWENSPLVIQEAYAANRPVICSNIGGMAEKVRHGETGLHFRVGSARELYQAIRRAADAKVYARLSPLPVPMSETEMARAYLDVFAQKLGGKRSKKKVGSAVG